MCVYLEVLQLKHQVLQLTPFVLDLCLALPILLKNKQTHKQTPPKSFTFSEEEKDRGMGG